LRNVKVLVTFAIEQEFAHWRRLRGFRKVVGTSPGVYAARIGSADVRVVLTGIGPEYARRVMQLALAEGADICISAGLAGGLRPRHRSGEVLAASAVLDSSGAVLEKSDASLVRMAAACGARVVDAFRTSDRVVLTAEEKARLASSADAVDMESFVVVSAARASGASAVALRVIGDTAEQDLPLDFGRAVDAKGGVSVRRVITQLARHPRQVRTVARLGKQTQRAAARLALFLDHYVENLVMQEQPEAFPAEVAG